MSREKVLSRAGSRENIRDHGSRSGPSGIGRAEDLAEGEHRVVGVVLGRVVRRHIDDCLSAPGALDGDIVIVHRDRTRHGEGPSRNAHCAPAGIANGIDSRLHRRGDIAAGCHIRVVISVELMASEEELRAEIERLRSENQALKKPARGQMSLKVSEKGALSV
jgi:hypothetical protein